VAPDAPLIILYADCFTTYNDPHIGLATMRVFNAFGYRVELADAGCCGRAAISTGLLADAQRLAAQAAQRLAAQAERAGASAVILCEPSCLSAIKDEWLKLNPSPLGGEDSSMRGIEQVRASRAALTDRCFLPEDFLEQHWDDHPRRPTFKTPRGIVALHAHCHQKALWGAQTSARLLHRIAPDHFRALDTGCCGMAGSFGYTADRYDLSMDIGELALFPAVRKLGPDDIIVAPGTSCRHQIHDGTKRTALHPIELIARLIQ